MRAFCHTHVGNILKGPAMETKRLRTMVYEIFKTLNNLNPVFMKDIFHYSPNVTRKKHNLYIHTQNTTKFGNKSLRAFHANIWNALPESCSMPEYIKSTNLLWKFKKIVKTWPGPKYKCSICKWEWNFLFNIFVTHNILQRWIQSAVRHEVELFLKTVNDSKSLKAVIAKKSTLGTWRGSEYSSTFFKLYIWKGGGFSE